MPFADIDITDSIERGFHVFFEWLPHLLGALAVLIIGFIVAKIVGNLVARALRAAGFDTTLRSGQAGNFVEKITSSPSRLLGRLAFWAVLSGAVSLAVSVLGIDALKDFVGAVFAYLPNLIAAFAIFLVAGAVAAAVSALVQRTLGDTTLGRIIRTVAPILVMAIATFMILDQLKIAETIVTITYAALLGALALGLALAFGLGGREVAGEMLRGAYQRGQANKDQLRRDLELGRERARQEVDRARSRVSTGESDDQLSARYREERRTSESDWTREGPGETGPGATASA